MAAPSPHYHVCIVRSWQEYSNDDNTVVWRYTLEIPSTSQRRGFNSRQALLDALSQELFDGKEPISDSKKPTHL